MSLKTVKAKNVKNNKHNKTAEIELFKVVGFVAYYWVETIPHSWPYSSIGSRAMYKSWQPVCQSRFNIYRRICPVSGWLILKTDVSGSVSRGEFGYLFTSSWIPRPKSLMLGIFRVTLSTVNYCHWIKYSTVKLYSLSPLLLVIYLFCTFLQVSASFPYY